jgi:hypothetical protein
MAKSEREFHRKYLERVQQRQQEKLKQKYGIAKEKTADEKADKRD